MADKHLGKDRADKQGEATNGKSGEEHAKPDQTDEGEAANNDQRDKGETLEGGEVAATVTGDGAAEVTHARKARGRRWEQVRREARGSGKNRREAIARANAVCAEEFPEVAHEYPAAELQGEPATDPPPIAANGNGEGDHLAGLGEIPASWPDMPANATLPVEAQWVQPNRLRVVEGHQVDLSRALAPAPSHSALAWLETAVLFPSKWADVTVKATANQADDQEATRREKGGLLEVRSLLDAMASG